MQLMLFQMLRKWEVTNGATPYTFQLRSSGLMAILFLQIIHLRDFNTLKPAICLPHYRFIVLPEHCVNYDVRGNIQLT